MAPDGEVNRQIVPEERQSRQAIRAFWVLEPSRAHGTQTILVFLQTGSRQGKAKRGEGPAHDDIALLCSPGPKPRSLDARACRSRGMARGPDGPMPDGPMVAPLPVRGAGGTGAVGGKKRRAARRAEAGAEPRARAGSARWRPRLRRTDHTAPVPRSASRSAREKRGRSTRHGGSVACVSARAPWRSRFTFQARQTAGGPWRPQPPAGLQTA